jgi:hypothetical protein
MIDNYQRIAPIILSRWHPPGPPGRADAAGRQESLFVAAPVVENRRSAGTSPTEAFTDGKAFRDQ